MDIEKKLRELRQFITKYRLFGPDEKILLAISGGVDSVVMGRVMMELGQPFDVVHCNFKLRGTASDGDETFVKELALQWNAGFFSTSFDTEAYAEQHGLSTQMAARELRYAYFEEVRQAHGHKRIATAHHVNDALETVLLNLSHGTGFRGLQGITPQRDFYVRPMLAFTGDEVRQLAAAFHLKWREDASNQKDDYERNKLRHHVVPVLQQVNPSLAATTKDTLERLWAADQALEQGLEAWVATHVTPDADYTEVRLSGETPSFFFYLHEYLRRDVGLAYKVFKQLEQSIEAGISGKVFLTDTHRINLDRDRLIINAMQTTGAAAPVFILETESETPFSLGVLKLEKLQAPVEIDRSASVALLDADRLQFPLEVRQWKEGDSFVPLGMSGQKKISDFMIDAKIPVNLKERVYLVLSRGEVVWIVGKRIDDRYKITSSTKSAYKLSLC